MLQYPTFLQAGCRLVLLLCNKALKDATRPLTFFVASSDTFTAMLCLPNTTSPSARAVGCADTPAKLAWLREATLPAASPRFPSSPRLPVLLALMLLVLLPASLPVQPPPPSAADAADVEEDCSGNVPPSA
jgi:hypothetical protein